MYSPQVLLEALRHPLLASIIAIVAADVLLVLLVSSRPRRRAWHASRKRRLEGNRVTPTGAAREAEERELAEAAEAAEAADARVVALAESEAAVKAEAEAVERAQAKLAAEKASAAMVALHQDTETIQERIRPIESMGFGTSGRLGRPGRLAQASTHHHAAPRPQPSAPVLIGRISVDDSGIQERVPALPGMSTRRLEPRKPGGAGSTSGGLKTTRLALASSAAGTHGAPLVSPAPSSLLKERLDRMPSRGALCAASAAETLQVRNPPAPHTREPTPCS